MVVIAIAARSNQLRDEGGGERRRGREGLSVWVGRDRCSDLLLCISFSPPLRDEGERTETPCSVLCSFPIAICAFAM